MSEVHRTKLDVVELTVFGPTTMKRSRLAIAGAIGIFVLLPLSCIVASPRYRAQFSPVQRYLYSRDGFYLVRDRRDMIWLTWWFESGVDISPESTLRWFNPRPFGPEVISIDEQMYRLSPVRDSWMLDFKSYSGTPFTYAALINPKNRHAEGQIRQIVRFASQNPPDVEAITKLAAKHYLFLGWTIQNEEDARALRDALKADWNLNRSMPIRSGAHWLYPIAAAEAKKASADPQEAERIESSSASILVLMENVDRAQGHPGDTMHVLYLDGHIDNIPFGSRFPATQAFFDAIRLDEKASL